MPTSPKTPSLSGIEIAVQTLGSQAALAERLRSRFPHKKHPSQQAISQWVQQGFVPASRAKEVAAVSGVEVSQLISAGLRDLLGGS